MNRSDLLALLHEHDKITVDDATKALTCKCGVRLVGQPGRWIDHLAEEILDRLPQPEPRVIPSRRSDPSTSHSSAASITMRAGSQRARLLEAFDGVLDATDEEAARRAEGVSLLSEYSKRCSELREAGLIEPTGETRAGASGQQRIVSRLTWAGHDRLKARR